MHVVQPLIPGSVIKVWSRRYLCWHKGMVDRGLSWNGEPQIIHSEKSSFVRTTSLSEFAHGETVSILWTPQTLEQQEAALQRMHLLDGKPYNLFVANCEHVVNWAVKGESFSEQLTFGVLIAAGLAAVAIGSRMRS